MRDSVKSEVMLLLILNNYTSRKALTSLLSGHSFIADVIKKLKESGEIKERTVGYKAKNRKEKKKL